jgi:short-subunit dehydrogenase
VELQSKKKIQIDSHRGIGRVLAHTLIKEEVKNLILCSRSLEKLKLVKEELDKIKKENQNIILSPCDVSNKNSVSNLIDDLFQKGIEIDFLYLLHGLLINLT